MSSLNQPHRYRAMLGNQEIVIETGKLAKLAGGAVTVQMGDSVLLVTATGAKSPREGISFFPLSVDFEERMYSAGKIPGSFFRREGRPPESSILLSRMVDRGLRPLFPKGYRNDVQIIVTSLSFDDQTTLDMMATLGASAALTISNVPFLGPIANVRIGIAPDGSFLVNPTSEQIANSPLDLRVTGTGDAINMVECASNEIDEEIMVQALELAHQSIQPLIAIQNQMREELGKDISSYQVFDTPDEVKEAVRTAIGDQVEKAIAETSTKEERGARLNEVYEQLKATLTDAETETLRYSEKDISREWDSVKKSVVRKRILELGERPDGRAPNEIRGLEANVDLLPRTHGSGVFTRGETQVLSVATLGTVGDAQTLDDLGQRKQKRYIHHYNFPPYSTGEAYPLRGPKRREIGHGALAENAIRPMMPPQEEFPYTVRVVSEVLASNGSSSMASVCGSTLALMDAGVPLKAPVGGIAMGLISDGTTYKVLTDIQGLEDHIGDMDFKVAGTRQGINALQMDIKIKGLSMDVLREALQQARDARLQIIDVIERTIPIARAELSPYAPRIEVVEISPDKIGKVIGPGGKTIRGIQEQTGAKIDIEEDGRVYIASIDKASAEAARRLIEALTENVELGRIYTGRVVSTREGLGAFVEVLPGLDGLVHISQLANYHVRGVEDVVQVGDEIMVMVTDIDDNDKVRLSRRAVLEGWDLETARANDAGSRRNRGGGGGNRGGGNRGRGGGGGNRGGGGGNRGGGGGNRGGGNRGGGGGGGGGNRRRNRD